MVKKSFEKVAIVSLPDQGNITSLVGIKNGDIYWDCGISHCPFIPHCHIIIKELENYKDDIDIDTFEIEYYASKCPNPHSPTTRLGWISPEGYYFPCSYTAHKYLSMLLTAKYYNNLDGERKLEEKGWLKISSKGIVLCETIYWLQPIIDTFSKIVSAFIESKESNFNSIFLDNPEHYSEIAWFTPPDDGDTVNRLVQELEEQVEGKHETVHNHLKLPKYIHDHPGD